MSRKSLIIEYYTISLKRMLDDLDTIKKVEKDIDKLQADFLLIYHYPLPQLVKSIQKLEKERKDLEYKIFKYRNELINTIKL